MTSDSDNESIVTELSVYSVDNRGLITTITLTGPDMAKFLDSGQRTRSAAAIFRDLLIFFQTTTTSYFVDPQDPADEDLGIREYPRILPRTGQNFYLIDMHSLKIICFNDRCLISRFDNRRHEAQRLVEDFTEMLSSNVRDGFKFSPNYRGKILEYTVLTSMLQSGVPMMAFELMVLDTALHFVCNRLRQRMKLVVPIVREVIDITKSNLSKKASSHSLLALKKTVLNLSSDINSVYIMVNRLLANEQDLNDLCLSRNRGEPDHGEVELIFEAYRDDLHEFQVGLASILEHLRDTNSLVNTYLDETRNKIIRMSLIIELATMGVGSTAVVTGIFGMNLKNGLEQDPLAFYVTVGSVILASTLLVLFFSWRLWRANKISKPLWTFPILSNLLLYADVFEDLKQKLIRRMISREEFNESLRKLDDAVSKEELDLIFESLEKNRKPSPSISYGTNGVKLLGLFKPKSVQITNDH